MPLFRAIGLVLILIALKFLVPAVFTGAENVLITFFGTVETVLEENHTNISAGFLPRNMPTVER